MKKANNLSKNNSPLHNYKNSLQQLIKLGISNSIVSYGIYMLTLYILQLNEWFPTVDYIVSNIVSWFISVAWSFYWNRRFVFKAVDNKEVPWKLALIKTYLSYAFTGLVLNNILLVIWIEVLSISKAIAPIINIAIGFPINFLLSKFWAFRKKS